MQREWENYIFGKRPNPKWKEIYSSLHRLIQYLFRNWCITTYTTHFYIIPSQVEDKFFKLKPSLLSLVPNI